MPLLSAIQDIQFLSINKNNPDLIFNENLEVFRSKILIIADGTSPEVLELLHSAAAPVVTLNQHASAAEVLRAITTFVAGEAFETVHIVAHGRPGAFNLGGHWIDAAALRASAAFVRLWRVGRIALWSCETGAEYGLLQSLHHLTGADIHAASCQLGRVQGRTSWDLDQFIGKKISPARLPVAKAKLANWHHSLARISFSGSIYQVTNTVDKESNSHTFNTTALAATYVIDDLQSGREFSGNDVSVKLTFTDTNNVAQTVYGWISRPIKVGGEVVGFYLWSDQDFTSLPAAQTDGNADGDTADAPTDPGTADNFGYVLVVPGKGSFFSTGNIGSSSDRVDSALNALIPANTAPVASADTSTSTGATAAIETGGVSNASAGVNASGNVLTNDTDANANDTKTVEAIGTGSAAGSVTAGTTSTNGTQVVGAYGTLTLGADGSYSYVINNSLAAVERLRLNTDTLADAFTYRMSDGAGGTSTTTLTITIKGANDAPVGVADYNTAKESLTTPSAVTGYSATGNVLTNDTDVDGYGETKSLASATASITSSVSSQPTSKLVFVGDSGFTANITNAELYVNVNGTYCAVFGSGGSRVYLVSKTETPANSNNWDIVLSATPTSYYQASGNVTIGSLSFFSNKQVGFENSSSNTENTAGMKTATVNSVSTSGGSTINLGSVSGDISVGMTVGGTGIPTGTKVTAISGSQITLDQAITSANGTSLTFSASGTYAGNHGSLTLNSDGSYTYTPITDNAFLAGGESATETFNYAVTDAGGLTSSSTLTITVYGSSTNDPIANADTANGSPGTSGGAALEAGAGVTTQDAIGNVLSNDTTPSGGTNAVTGAKLATAANNQSVSSGTTSANGTQIIGLYGTLTIGANGTYSYAINNGLAAVQALNSGDTLQEVFSYTIRNGLKLGDNVTFAESTALLTVQINGSNDAGVAADDAALALETGGLSNATTGLNPSGNVLTNDSDVDGLQADLRVTAIRTGAEASSGISGSLNSALSGLYGSLTLQTDGTWTYLVNNNNAAVESLGAGQSLTDYFTYTVTDQTGSGASDTGTLQITIQGAADTVSVTNVFVNEASPFAVFQITGGANQAVTLSLGNSTGLASGDAKATLGTDLSNTLQYFDGSSWQNYAALNPPTLGAGGTLLVRVAVTPDTASEGNESFTLDVTTTDGSVARGIGTIGDEGDGSIFLSSNNTSTANVSGDVGFPTQLDDDRILTVANITVNEASSYAVFEVVGVSGQLVQLALTNGTALGGSTSPTDGSVDYNTAIQYWDGSAWQNYASSAYVALPSTGTLKVRMAIVNDTVAEGNQTFTLTATNTGGVGTTGTATINDSGGGVIYTFDANNGSSTGTSSSELNNDAPAGLTVSAGPLTTGEAGSTAQFTVVLNSQPTSDVTVTITGLDATEGSLSATTLTFTAANWNTAQTITVTGADDLLVDGSQNYTLTATSSSSDSNYSNKTGTITVTNTDNDTAGITVSAGPLTTGEAGSTAQFTVVLNSQPTSDVTVTITGLDATEGSLSATTLTFTAANWNTAQTITVTGADDLLVDGSQNYTLTATSSSSDSNYSNKTGTITVTNTDNDTAGITVSAGPLTTGEVGSTAQFTVVLNSQPTSDVTVTITGLDATEGSLSATTLTFTAANWNTAQTITVTGADDLLVDGSQNYTLTATSSSSDSNYSNKTGTITVTNTDNDTAGITVSAGPLTTGEAGSTAQFTVVLNSQPTSDVTVTITGLDATEGSLSATTLTFTAANWNTAQTITVTGADDLLVDGSQNYTLTATSSSSDSNYSNKTGTITVTNTDNDTAGITVSAGPLTTGEAGSTAQFTVVLNSQPTSDVTVTITGLDATEGSLSATTLTFTAANWNTAQTITVTGADDLLVDGSQNYTLTATSSSSDSNYSNKTGTITVTNTDNDTAGITVSAGPLTTGEAGSTAQFTVVLNSQPTSDVTVTITGLDATEGSLSATTLTFTAANWNTAQTITVTGADDLLVDGSQNYTLTATSSSSDSNYSNKTGTITVTNTDNDTAGITVSAGPLTTGEAGSTAQFTVVLNSQPTSDVTVTITGLDATEGSLSATTLTFTAANWNTAQTITVTGADDLLVDGSQNYTLTATSSSSDSNYSNKTGTITVTNTDNDTAGITVSAGPLTTGEAGSTAQFTVVLNSQPTSDVTVTITGLDATEGSLSATTLTFTAANWNTAQTITVTGADDLLVDGSQNYTLTATSSSSDSNYSNKTGTITVTNTDNDTAGITVSAGPLTTGEAGSTAQFTVVLNSQPTSDVTVTITGLDATEGSLSATTLTFTAANWNTAQTITVTGADDLLVDGSQNYTLTATSSSSDSNYSNKTGTITVTNTDNDTAGITVSAGPLTTGEAGSTAQFTVVLNSQPTSDVTVTITGLDATEGSLSATTLTFTAANWNTAQTITVTGADDLLVDGSQNYTLTATSSSSDSNYSNKTGTITVTNTDNDTAGITVSAGPLTTGEAGSTAQFTVVLNSQPTSDVTVTITGLDATEGSLSATTLTFTAANWNTAQTITVTGADDLLVDGSQNYTLTATSSSSDSNYSNKTGTITVTNTDNDTAGITVSAGPLTTGEAGSTAQFTVVLNSQPTSDVTVTITGLDATEGSLSATTLTFTAANWNTAQTITVTGADDLLVDGSQNYTLTATSSSSDSNYSNKTGTITVTNTDNDRLTASPIIVDVTEISTDPTPNDLLTSDVTQAIQITGTPGFSMVLYTIEGQRIDPSNYTVTETEPGVFSLNAQNVNLLAGEYVVRQIDSYGYESPNSNSFVIDSTPEVEENTNARELVSGVGLTGRFEVIDQNRINLTPFQYGRPPAIWYDSDGQQAIFGLQGGFVTGNLITLTLPNGSSLEVNRLTGTYFYKPDRNATLDFFPITIRDPGGKGGNITVAFEARDLLDRDGIPSNTEDQLGMRVTSVGDLNNDGISDSVQSAVTTLAWIQDNYFTNAVQGNMTLVPNASIITVVANTSLQGADVSPITQLINFNVLPLDRDGLGGLPMVDTQTVFAPWDPLAFSIEPLQSLGLIDLDPTRAGLQLRITIDISHSGVREGEFNAYYKWVSAEVILAAQAAGIDLVTLDGVALTSQEQAGWYDFTARSPDGDGAHYIVEDGLIKSIELMLTDNAFGDVDFTVGRLSDPGMPVAVLGGDLTDAAPMYRADLRSGDRLLTRDNSLANEVATSEGSTSAIEFWVMREAQAELVPLAAWRNLLTGDLFYAPQGSEMPYACYVPIDAGSLGYVPTPGQGAFDLSLWIDQQGITQIVSDSMASEMNLSGRGFENFGAIFSSAVPMSGISTVSLLGVTELS